MITKVYGPPGTGKTTWLLKRVENAMMLGTEPRRIGYVAFTRKAAYEAKSKACRPDEELVWFRTIHSFAFKVLGARRGQLVDWRFLKDLGEWLQIPLGGDIDEMTGMPVGNAMGDRALRILHLARNQLRSLEEQWQLDGEDLTWAELEWFARGYSEFKKKSRRIDFTDLLEKLCQAEIPDLDLLILDEAQDLTPLQWKVFRHLSDKVKDVYIAGDDDQAIYAWAGASAEELIHQPADETVVLETSHRCPSMIFTQANRITQQIETRARKDWKPSEAGGHVYRVSDLDDLEESLEKGTWYLLARNRYLLRRYEDMLRRLGFLYTTHAGLSVDAETMRVIQIWEAMRKNSQSGCYRPVPPEDLKLVTQYLMKSFEIADLHRPWYEALDRIGREEREYLRSCLRRGERISQPRIHVDTIHGVKGGEADHVVLLQDVSRACMEHTQQDNEWRVWYVGATRARQTLTLVAPEQRTFVMLP